MSVRSQTLLWLAQRVSGGVLALAVIVHLATVIYAVRGGLSGAEILARVQGNVAWLLFYLTFVVAAAVHAPIGVRTILTESTALPEAVTATLAAALGLALLILGARAALALFGAG